MRARKCIRKRECRRRIRQGICTFFIGFLIAVMVIILCGGKMHAVGYDYVSGTSLWEIAKEHCPDSMDKRDYIAEVMKLNGMENCTVYANRLYQVPVYAD